MTNTLITGANKGLGREAARRLIEAGHTVWVGARNAEAGQAVADELGARFVQLDVTDDASVAAAVATITAAGGLDVLINNAGISGDFSKTIPDTTAADVAHVFETNVFGIVRVTQAFIPLLAGSTNPVVVNVSSGLASQALSRDPDRVESTVNDLAYCPSKAAVTMLTTHYAKAYPAFRINAVDPGYTATDLNGNSGHQTVTEGTDAIVTLAQITSGGPTATFQDRDGIVPW